MRASAQRLFAVAALSFSVAAFTQAPPSATGSEYSFNPINVKRDPFLPPTVSKPKETNEIVKYDLGEMNLVAILTGIGAPQAMIVLPNQKTHILQIGDPIGKHNGRVFKITATEVVVKENFTDYQGKRKTNLTSLVLAQ